MAGNGHGVADFGAFPGRSETTGACSGEAGILASSDAEAWLRCETSADHTVDEHDIEDMIVKAKDIIPGVGFTVVLRPRDGICYGVYNFSWVWA